MPDAEVILWSRLKGKQLGGFKFRRQYGVGKFSIDFYCAERKLAIEVDGASHYTIGEQEKDRERQEWIEQFEIQFLRFTNDDVYKNLDGVLMMILEKLEKE
jgi:very-short-patch-repair endonuclease